MVAIATGTRGSAPAAAMGMDKSGTQSIAVGSWEKITGWTVRSGFTASNIAGDSLVMNGYAIGTVTLRGGFGTTTGTQQFQAYLNGVAIGSVVNRSTVGTVPGVEVNDGDTLDLYGFTSTGNLSGEVVSAGSTNTYIYFTPD